jgi:S1-C subfamily serine protease
MARVTRQLGWCAAALCVLAVGLVHSEEGEFELRLAPRILNAEAGKPVQVSMSEGGPRIQGLRIRVPEDAEATSLHVRVRQATADIDLWLCDRRARNAGEMLERTVQQSITGRVNERLDYAPEGGLKAGTYFVYAGSLTAGADEDVQFKVILTLDEPPEPEPLPELPFKPLSELQPLERAVLSCVLLMTDTNSGTGTVVSPCGLILTNMHVLLDDDEEVMPDIYVSFVRDARSLPVQTHMARVVELHRGNDLALLQIHRDIHGREVVDSEFTWLSIAPDVPGLGEELRCLGYPAIGSTRSLGSITLTRGVVSGYVSRRDELQWITTDALMSVGNSGGAAINASHQLVGVPTESLHAPDTLESLGYIRPVGALPASWRGRITEALPGAKVPDPEEPDPEDEE